MTRRELDAAGITEPALRASYTACRRLNARHGRTYFLATRLLPADRRPAVHALYGFARWADDIVDDLDGATEEQRSRLLGDLTASLTSVLAGGRTEDPVVRALADTAVRYRIPAVHFTDFLASMRSDLSVTHYPTMRHLRDYMHGSAAVIGLQMLPVLGTVGSPEEAAPYAAALGEAFQLTNFIRDVGEDLDRGRVYLPSDLLSAHGVDRDLLLWSRGTGRGDPRITEALKAAAAHTRGVYARAEPGIGMLQPASRPCIRTAFVLYGDILDAVARDGYASLHRRSTVPRRRRAAIAGRGLVRAVAARRRRPGAPPQSASARPVPTPPAGGAAQNVTEGAR
ncbi:MULTISPECIES: phytoene/squalene synthase family protein [unclassified Streptomyces]|uniref:phytoene/squalene synthase family protein n=1 Tax=unclassified Streptomyces TaxID=2593676 RepID=UPI002E2EB2A5|nr:MULTISPECIES: phytoene/squalene synthase family protein [unclassified Streptomyces]WUC68147.1 phytoene/squalene synthase family protein [Streptomyces sp. NBC_00539]